MVYQLETTKEKALFYKNLLSRDLILEYLESNLEMSIEDYLIELGKKYVSNVYVIDDIYLEVKINDSLSSDSEIININYYPDNTTTYYMDSNEIGCDCTSYHRDYKCFMLPDISYPFSEALGKLSFNLNLDENQLNIEEKDNYYLISLNDDILGVWNQELLDNFYSESEDVRLYENHSEDWCDECIEGNYCKYSNPNISLEKKLLSDKLNIPIFSISLLLEKLNRKVTVHEQTIYLNIL